MVTVQSSLKVERKKLGVEIVSREINNSREFLIGRVFSSRVILKIHIRK